MLEQDRHHRGRKVYSLHAPEVECIGKGKAHRPLRVRGQGDHRHDAEALKGGQFVIHAKALPGNPYDGHTLATIIPEMEELIGNELERILADAGYRGHNAPPDHRFRVYTSARSAA